MSLAARPQSRWDGSATLCAGNRCPCPSAPPAKLPEGRRLRHATRSSRCFEARSPLVSCLESEADRITSPPRHSDSRRHVGCRAAELDRAGGDGAAVLEEEREGQNGGSEPSGEDMLDLIQPDTVPTPIFDTAEAVQSMLETVHDQARQNYGAFFSSVLGGIVTDPAIMTLPIDDHLVHRGHGVFDTASIVDGSMYGLEAHFNRFLWSADRAAIQLPMSPDQMVRTILETAAASNVANGHVRYWLSPGRGGFGLSPRECDFPTFYAVVYKDDRPPLNPVEGWKVKTSPVPAKDPYFSTLKSTNYLQNALNLLDAQTEGFDQGIFVDADGNVAEGPNMNVAILTADDVLVTPPFDTALAGITIQRMLELIPHFLEKGILQGVAGFEQRHISLEEAKAAKEVMLTSSSLPVMPVLLWDDTTIGAGEAGPVAMALHAMMQRDATPQDKMGDHMPVPYGYVTGMIPEAM